MVKKRVSVLVVETGHLQIYGRIFEKRFAELGLDSYGMYLHKYFKNIPYPNYSVKANPATKIYYKFQNKFCIGPVVKRINEDLYNFVRDKKIDLLFLYRNNFITPKTIERIKNIGTAVFDYNNDDPFSNHQSYFRLRNYFQSLPLYDQIFVYSKKNIEDIKKRGLNNVSLLRGYYIKERNFPIPNIHKNRYSCDVIFIGHWEDDGRDEYIKLLLDNDIDVKIYGPFWERSKHYRYFLKKMNMEKIAYLSDDYNLALNSAKTALVFLSKKNNNTYTQRCFEIPATKTAMVCEYTDDMARNLFEEDKEAVYFKSAQELLEKIRFLLSNEKRRIEIATNGYKRLLKDGHEALDRCKRVIDVYDKIKREDNKGKE